MPLLHSITDQWTGCRYHWEDLEACWPHSVIEAAGLEEEAEALRAWLANTLG
jgi:hypothetical protein